MTQLNWSDDRVEQLKSLWQEGLSAGQVAQTLGGVSRCAVIGKVHRLGLAGRANHPQVSRARLPSAVKTRLSSKAALVVPIVEEEPLQLDDGSFATLLTISDRMCHWPIGDPTTGDFHFCGRGSNAGSPYCEAHARRAHRPRRTHGDSRQDQKGRVSAAES